IGCGCLSLESCVLSNPDDVFGERQGAGSRLLVEKRRDKEERCVPEERCG
ncbi:MAG: redox-sensitive transcriptional activator SoxR, partial [Streptomyces sp.]|nr:redox-sensitive transcriptional activator SoxR [Streptomyces sp.]